MVQPIRMVKIKQSFDRHSICDVERVTRDQLAAAAPCIKLNARVAIAVGSRGITNLARIVRTTAEYIREKGGRPFVVPAMGSHGGATAEGQTQLLASYGVAEAHIGCPVLSSMDVVELPSHGLKHKLFMDRHAYESDGIIPINRIKPHTDFHGTYESGLVKMCVIGLGKERQASEVHRYGVYGLKELVPHAAQYLLASGKVILGIGIVENAYDETTIIEAISPDEIMFREPQLLTQAQKNMPRLPIDKLDLLIVDIMGKDISGVGMDTNIIGRIKIRGEREPVSPNISMIVVADLTAASHGNATGVGLADVITRRLFEKINFPVTHKNVVTSAFLERGKIPVVAETDRQAVEYALRSCGAIPTNREKIIRIKDTLHLNEIYVSPAVLEEINGRGENEVTGEFVNLFPAASTFCQF